jgi:uncharacterized protein YjbI with pentapeptide repeats
MANQKHLDLITQGVGPWNQWRSQNPSRITFAWWLYPEAKESLTNARMQAFLDKCDWEQEHPGVEELDLSDAKLSAIDLSKVNLSNVNLNNADLQYSNLTEADLSGAILSGAKLDDTDLTGANLSLADLKRTTLHDAKLRNVNLSGSYLEHADCCGSDFSSSNLEKAVLNSATLRGTCFDGAKLIGADLTNASLNNTSFIAADLTDANLSNSIFTKSNLSNANLTGCYVFGVSVWGVVLDGTIQKDLRITHKDEPVITVDNVEVAQFIYLILNNSRIRDVIDTIAKRAVLILGRFTPERKAILDAIRDELRRHNYLPLLFDFDKPSSRNLTETVSTLAHMSRFVIADITDAKSIPQELQRIIPDLPSLPIQPLLLSSQYEYAMFKDFTDYPWVLSPYRYDNLEGLLASLEEKIIAPAEAKATEIEERRRAIEEQMNK